MPPFQTIGQADSCYPSSYTIWSTSAGKGCALSALSSKLFSQVAGRWDRKRGV